MITTYSGDGHVETTERDPYEALQEELDPHRREELERAMLETRSRLRERGVRLTGRETSEELFVLPHRLPHESVERYLELLAEATRAVVQHPPIDR